MTQTLNFLFVGDIVSNLGVDVFLKHLPNIKNKYSIDSIIVNGENSAKNGKGITAKIAEQLKTAGVDIVTSGNHIWENREIYDFLNKTDYLLRPANFPSDCPGKGYAIYQVKDKFVGVINLQGRVFMRENIDCPFRKAESLLTLLKSKTNMIIVDFHAEASSEKRALGNYLDGKISLFCGTHTHIQTADERLLPNGTAYITDVGFCGAHDSILGMEKDSIITKFITQLPTKFKPETKPPFEINAIYSKIDSISGKALAIERIRILDNVI